jgi:alkanesulfonate monooxygenase SsuD/methylene tetrahydromethanopterin reductase-like flavin-dependent oxidoreductase (luciferase family)
MSAKTIEYTAKNGIVPFILKSYPPDFTALCKLYQEVAAQSGRKLALGEGVGCLRSVHFGNTEAQAVELHRRTHYHAYYDYFGGFGFWDAWRMPGDEEKYPMNPFTPLPKSEWTQDRMRKAKYSLVGTVDQIKREIETLIRCHGDQSGNLEWFAWYFDQGLMSWDDARRQIELFAEHIVPEFGDRPAANRNP